MHFTFDEAMMATALEANGWRNVWDIYWVRDAGPEWGGLTTDDAFLTLLQERNLLPRRNAADAPKNQASER